MHPLLSVILAMASCNQEASPRKISPLIREHCTSKEECVIDMGNIVKTPWEKMYVFKESASLEQINQILGFQYKYFEDIGRRIIFVKNNEVVYHEDEFPSREVPRKGQLVFKIPDSLIYKIYYHNKAFFFS